MTIHSSLSKGTRETNTFKLLTSHVGSFPYISNGPLMWGRVRHPRWELLPRHRRMVLSATLPGAPFDTAGPQLHRYAIRSRRALQDRCGVPSQRYLLAPARRMIAPCCTRAMSGFVATTIANPKANIIFETADQTFLRSPMFS